MIKDPKSGFLITALICVVVPFAPSAAQVAPTEVSEEAVDEFGIERMAGRSVWWLGKLVGIRPKGARIGMSGTGNGTLPNEQEVKTVWRLDSFAGNVTAKLPSKLQLFL